MIAPVSKIAGQQPNTIYTIGHSTHPIDEFIGMLKACDIETLVAGHHIPAALNAARGIHKHLEQNHELID